MTRLTGLAALFAATALTAGTALAQTNTAFTGTDRVDDLREDLDDDIADDFDRDLDRFGNEGRPLGFEGSLALRASATDGNDETSDIGLGANLGYFDGLNGYEASLYYAYSRSTNDDGDRETDENRLLYDLQYTRDFSPVLYGFVKLQGSYNGDDDNGTDLERENDVFLGFGAGYRIYNTPDIQWSVQAGPGYRFANFSDINRTIVNFDDSDVNEAAFAVSSNYANRLSDTMTISNDTDIISSSSDTVVYNDLGLNIAMNDALALRTSVVTEYHTDPAPGEDSTDNTFGLSLVYSFN